MDRKAGVPKVDNFPALSFPSLQRGKLKNGIEVVLAERHSIPVVQLSMLFDGGYAADQGRKLGTSSFTMAMLDEGTKSLDALHNILLFLVVQHSHNPCTQKRIVLNGFFFHNKLFDQEINIISFIHNCAD